MPRRRTTFTQGAYYHIYNRGAAQVSIFRGDEDYRYLLTLVKRLLTELQITMIAYCLLPNHYHWLVRQDGAVPVRLLAQRVWKSYANHFNNRYDRSGALFEDRYKAIPVTTDSYLRDLCLYIHTNPVKHGLVARPELWSYSNYLEWIGARQGRLLDQTLIATYSGSASAYQTQVETYLAAHHFPPVPGLGNEEG